MLAEKQSKMALHFLKNLTQHFPKPDQGGLVE